MTKRIYGPRQKPGPKFKTQKCAVDGCDDRANVGDYCTPHYDRWRRTDSTQRARRIQQWKDSHEKRIRDPKYVEDMKQRRVATLERYRERNRDNIKQSALLYQRKRRAWLLDADSEPYTDQDVLEIYGTDCHICEGEIDLNAPRLSREGGNWKRGLHIDHVIALSNSGSDTLDNVRPSHAICNIQKNARTNWREVIN